MVQSYFPFYWWFLINQVYLVWIKLIGLGIGNKPMKVQVVFFVQGIVPSSFTLWSSFSWERSMILLLRFYGLFGIGWKEFYQLEIYCTRRTGERGKRTPNPQLVVYPLSRSNKRTLLKSNLRVVLVFDIKEPRHITYIHGCCMGPHRVHSCDLTCMCLY